MDLLNETLDLIDKYENEKRRNLSVNSASTIVQREDISQRESTTESNITRINSNRSSNFSDLDSFAETESDYYSSSDSEEIFLKESSEEYRSFPVDDGSLQNDKGMINKNSNNNTNQNNNLLTSNILRKPRSNSTFSTPELICDSNEYDSSSSYDESYKENTNRVQSNTNPTIIENKGLKGSLLFKSNKSDNIEEIVKPDTKNSDSKRFDDFVIPKRGISLDDSPGPMQVTHYYSKQKKSPIFISTSNEVKGQAEEDVRDSLSSSSLLSNDQHGKSISRSFTIGSPYSVGSPYSLGSPVSSFAISSPNVSFNGDIPNNVRPISSIYRNQDKNAYRSSKKVVNNSSAIEDSISKSLSPNFNKNSNIPIKSIKTNNIKPVIENQVNIGKNKLENFNSISPLVKPINGKMSPINGKMSPVNGKMSPINGKMSPTNSNIKILSHELTSTINISKKPIPHDESKSNNQSKLNNQDKITEELSSVFHMIDEMENNKNIMERKQNQELSNNRQSKSKHSRKSSQASIKEISKNKIMVSKDIPMPDLPNDYRLPDQNSIKYQNPNSNSNHVLPKSLVNNNRDKREKQEKYNLKLSSQIDVIPSYQRSPMHSHVGSVISFRPEDSMDFSRNNTINTSSSDSDNTRMTFGGPSNTTYSSGQGQGQGQGQDELQMILNSSYVDSMKDRAIYEQQQHQFFKQQHKEMHMKMMQKQQQQQFQNHIKIQKLQQKAMMQQQLKQKNNPNIKGSSSPSLRMNNIYSPVTSIADLPLNDFDFDNRSFGSPVVSPSSTFISMDESIRSSKMSNFRQMFIPVQPDRNMDFISSNRAPSFEGMKDSRSRSPSFKPVNFGTPNGANMIKVSSNSSYSRMPVPPQYMNSPVASKKNIFVDDNSNAAAKQRYYNKSPTVRSVVSNNDLEVSMRNNNIRSPIIKGGYNVSSENISTSKLGKRPVLKKATSIGSSLGSYGVTDERKLNSRKYFN